MRLMIKGSPKNAKRAAARRGIPVRNCHALATTAASRARDRGRARNDTVCDAPESARVRVMHWLAERGVLKEGRGYAPGSLLFFNGARRRRGKR